VLNKFRGDAALLAPGPQMLQDLTGVPTVATCRCGGSMACPRKMV
jgi:cobyric acid synthase